jgi:L-iditol 2-dehydrogenase
MRRIPSHVSLEAAALLEPLSVAIHATRRAKVEPGATVIVFGSGTIGLLTAAMAQVCGASKVLIADIDTGRVGFALKHRYATRGAVLSIRQCESLEDRLEAAKELAADVTEKLFAGDYAYEDEEEAEGADIVFDCTGKEICVQAGLHVSYISPFNQSEC